jgi:ABC-type transporter Mla MlaB component
MRGEVWPQWLARRNDKPISRGAVCMEMIAVFLNIHEESVVPALQEAGGNLDCTQGEAVLDFSSVRRIDASALQAMEGFARIADEKAVKIVLRGVNPEVYKVLKLVKLADRFSYVN